MLHLNERLRQYGPRANLLEILLPQTYAATSLREFLDSRSEVKPTRRLSYPALHYWGAAVVHVPRVQFELTPDRNIGLLSDATASLEVSIAVRLFSPGLTYRDRAMLEDHVQLFKASLVYFPASDHTRLIGYKNAPLVRKRHSHPSICDFLPSFST